jgi:hypothetical protein
VTGARLSLLGGAACAALLFAALARAQTPADSTAAPAGTPDSIAAPPAASTPAAEPPAQPAPAPPPLPESQAEEFARDRDRFELGAAAVSGTFDVLGTLGYHRLLRQGRGPFEIWMHLELAGGGKGYLREGAGSVGFLLRPTSTIHRDWPIRPILEFGPAAHVVMQGAEIRSFGENAFHTHVYLKTHGYAGFDIPLGARLGLVARGRLSIPAHRPLDYAQIALFLR